MFETRVGGHEPGLLKIVYELAWYWLGDTWLRSDEATAMREIFAGQKPSTPLRGKVYNDGDAAIIALGGDTRLLHIAWLYRFENQLILFVRLFDLFTVGFVVAADASQYEFPERNAIIMQNVERQYEETQFEMTSGQKVWEHNPSTSHLS